MKSSRLHLITALKRTWTQPWRPLLPASGPVLTLAGAGLALLATLLLPLNLLATQPFHHDEALYATWALPIAAGSDPWLANVAIDKPPLFLYILAGSMLWLGPTETAARLPSLVATVASVWLTFRLGQTFYNDRVGLLAAWLAALSPFTIAFAPTALTDPLLVTLVLAAGLAAARKQAGRAGVWLGLAFITKQQAIFFAPLVVGLLIIAGWNRNTHPSRFRFYALRFTLAICLTLLPALTWDWIRGQSPGVWQLSLVHYGGLSAAAGDWPERGRAFAELLAYATGSPLLNVIFMAGLPLLLIYDLAMRDRQVRRTTNDQRPTTNDPGYPRTGKPPTNDASSLISPSPHLPISLLLALFILLFLLGHIFLSFQVWDRYLLGLIPFLALLFARILLLPWSLLKRFGFAPGYRTIIHRVLAAALIYLLVTTMFYPVQNTANARYPLGSNSGALHGLEQIVAYLQGNIGANNTLYHRWLGAHWRFYLWNYPYDLQYWGSPQELAARAKPGHLLAFPWWRSETEARLALAEAGLKLREVTRAYHPAGYPSIILYRIERTP